VTLRLSASRSLLAVCSVVVAHACSEPAQAPDRAVVAGRSPLVGLMNEAAREHDVPAELLAALAWTETALIPPRVEAHAHDEGGAHAPPSYGVMGLPEQGRTRSAALGAQLLGVDEASVRADARDNVRAAAAILRHLADELYGPGALASAAPRDRWLRVAERYLDAGPEAAREVRRAAARGVEAFDAEGRSLIIPSYAELWPEEAPSAYGTTRRGLNGEYPGSTFVAANSGNFTNDSRTAADIDVVVIHTVQGSYAGAISWFQNPSANVSAHYTVRRSDGAITQSVRHADIAWHAGNWSYNQRSIGIEHEGFIADANNYTPAMLQASAALTRWLCDNLGIPKDRSHIIGHIEVPGATHTDPGPHFPWQQYMDLVNNGATMMPPMAGTGVLQGVVYIGTDNTQRIPGATITVTPGNHTASARAGDAFWTFNLAPGNYTITAAAPGYTSASVTRAVTDGGQAWGSIGLVRATTTPGLGKLKGSVFDARHPDFSVRLPGASLRLSNGTTLTARDPDGYFEFSVPEGDYTVTVTKGGWQSETVTRSVVAGQDTWGSIGLSPETSMPTNRAPGVPQLDGPKGDVTARAARPIFTVTGLADADRDALSLDVELYADEALTTRVSSGRVSVGSAATASWQHPADDLPRGAPVWWRVRARDAQLAGGWTPAETFRVYDDASATVASTPWEAPVLPGLGPNRAPGAPLITDPADMAVLTSVRPRVAVLAAMDPEGDALAYELEVAADDVFTTTEVVSGLVEDTAWVVARDLAPGSTYYVRARAADARVFGPWSAPVAFVVSTEAVGEDRPGFGTDVGAPELEATAIAADGGCSTTPAAGPAALIWGGLLLALVYVGRSRRR
jgi:hypothetical protein